MRSDLACDVMSAITASIIITVSLLRLFVSLSFANPFRRLFFGEFFYKVKRGNFDTTSFKEGLYRIQILCRRHPFWSYPAGLTIADPIG